ncbi:MAG: translation initiation factor IF-3 [Candidatus Cloacimonetes bacterium]|nr:translation initiation factor IF-3 [Candidatus Cloacimonadota bacterium]
MTYFKKSSRWRNPPKKKNKRRINHQIKVQEVRLVGPEKEPLGIMSTRQAQQKAEEFGLDLVEVAPNSNPPVCKIIDYKKFLFEESKKAKQAKKKQKSTQLKEIKFRPRTEEHDYNFKVKNIKNFLEKNYKVKITIQFRGREMAHKELGYDLMKKLKEELSEFGSFENNPKMEGRFLIAFVSAKKK